MRDMDMEYYVMTTSNAHSMPIQCTLIQMAITLKWAFLITPDQQNCKCANALQEPVTSLPTG